MNIIMYNKKQLTNEIMLTYYIKLIKQEHDHTT